MTESTISFRSSIYRDRIGLIMSTAMLGTMGILCVRWLSEGQDALAVALVACALFICVHEMADNIWLFWMTYQAQNRRKPRWIAPGAFAVSALLIIWLLHFR